MIGQPQWSHETAWRQGCVLDANTTEAIQLCHADAAATCVVIVSHDCDLAIDNLQVEPDVEIIVGRLVSNSNGNYSWGKSPRTLHLPMVRNGVAVTVELDATKKQLVSKSVLAAYSPDSMFELDGAGLAVLRSWLSARYNRAAFPDAFVRRMNRTKVDQKLAKKLEPNGSLISFVYFDLDGGRVLERVEGEPYELTIVLVYPPGNDPEASAEAADDLAESIFDACESRLKDGKQIVLKACIAISEDDLTVSKARVLNQWRLEYMTLRANDEASG